MILNNEPGQATRHTCRNTTFIINLTFTNPKIGALETWIIDKKLSMLPDHEVIVCNFENLDQTVGEM